MDALNNLKFKCVDDPESRPNVDDPADSPDFHTSIYQFSMLKKNLKKEENLE